MSKPANILIVDDEPNVRLMFRTALASSGYQVTMAEDGASALDWLAGGKADVILLDLHMPGMDGMEVLQRLRESGDDTPIVIVTAHGNVPNAVQAMKLGAIDFLTKPLTPDKLRATVADVIERQADRKHVAESPPAVPEPVTAASQFADDLRRAKRALNRCAFDEAEVFLKQAIALNPNSAETHNLMGVLHECRNEHDASYREYKAALKADRHYGPAKHNLTRYYERFTFGRSDLLLDKGDTTEEG
ncbi:response regulator [Singulisphaera acidiphila]|uniref:Response regulator with CheY-like receiver, AAA-type ATPase, and DNA-binding domains n=1 Tax=Singulisphaera acidiphila (strain ATCC BAA-1392 / DSM 18658 / VKM B-2454 / MOB10) TaxID=886293 RepID=L0DLX4_SINAD|nr:response regulator [Singulisphaera acidiphila]AGA29681.1 response regulator with CheY-like receiver, AAA-type ATPase, and DNA-binding domains [Singulisphaera acidiphila DSM 18658]